MFSGESTQKVDAKGRVSVPVLLRRDMEPAAIDGRIEIRIVYGNPKWRHLECYTRESFAALQRRIGRMKAGSPDRELLEELYVVRSHPTEIDSDGRLILPQKLRAKAELAGEALFLGRIGIFEIWNPEIYAADKEAKFLARMAELPDDMNMLQLLPDDTEEV